MKKTLYIWMFLLVAMMPLQSFAVTDSFNFEGVLTDSGGNPITSSTPVVFQVLSADSTCILYSESQSVDPETDGSFSKKIGTAPSHANRDANDSNNFMSDVFGFVPSVSGKLVSNGNPCVYNPAVADSRKLRVVVNGNALSPFYDLSAVPMAKIAENAEKVGGVAASSILKANVGQNVDQSNLENIFGGVGYSNLLALINGTSGQYQSSTPTASVDMNNQTIQNVGAPLAASHATNKQYVDSSIAGRTADNAVLGALSGGGDIGKVMSWDGTKWTATVPSATDVTKLPLAGGTMTGAINMSSQNLLNAGHVSLAAGGTLHLGNFTNATESALVAGLIAGDKGKVWYNVDTSDLKMWNGSSAIIVGANAGAAGGDLTGSYPNPTIANNAINSSKLAAGAVTAPAIAANAINSNHIANNAIVTTKLFANPGSNYLVMTDGIDGSTLVSKSCLVGEVLKWTMTGWTCAADSTGAGGTVTGIAVGTGLTGGPISSEGTISIAAGGVNTAELGANAVTAAKLNNDAVTSAKIFDGTISTADLAAKAITTALINDSAINALQINDDAVTSSKILNGTIVAADLSSSIANGLWTASGSDVYRSAGNVGIGTITPNEVLSVNGVMSLGETNAPIADASFGKLYVKSSDSKLYFMDDSGAETDLLASTGGTVTNVTAGSGLSGGAIFTTGTIGIQAGGVTNSHLAADSVTSAKILDGTIAPGDLSFSPGDFKADGSVFMTQPIRASAGSVALPSITFSGDTDSGLWSAGANIVSMSTGATERMRIDAAGNVGIGTTGPTAHLEVTGATSSTSGTYNQGLISHLHNPAGPSNSNVYSLNATTSTTGSSDTLGKIVGIRGSFSNLGQSGGTNTLAIGILGESQINGNTVINASYGVLGQVNRTNGGSVTKAIGVGGNIINNTATSYITDAIGGDFSVTNTTGTINNAYGVYIGSVQGTGARYSLYSQDPTATAYFSGNVGMGTNTPTANLDVKGTLRLSGTGSGGVNLRAPTSASGGTYTWPMNPPAGGSAVLTSDNAGNLNWTPHQAGDNVVPSGSTADFTTAKVVILQAVGGNAITLAGLTSSGEYTIIIQDTTSRMYTFSGGPCGGGSFFSPVNGATTAATQSVYKINYVQSQSKCYINWTTGY